MQAVSLYEAAAEFWPQYLRGEAYLKLGRGDEAATDKDLPALIEAKKYESLK